MEWYKIVFAVVSCGGFILIMIKLFFNKLMVKLDGVIKTLSHLSRVQTYSDGRINAIFKAIDKTIGNGFNERYDGFMKEEVEEMKYKK